MGQDGHSQLMLRRVMSDGVGNANVNVVRLTDGPVPIGLRAGVAASVAKRSFEDVQVPAMKREEEAVPMDLPVDMVTSEIVSRISSKKANR